MKKDYIFLTKKRHSQHANKEDKEQKAAQYVSAAPDKKLKNVKQIGMNYDDDIKKQFLILNILKCLVMRTSHFNSIKKTKTTINSGRVVNATLRGTYFSSSDDIE